MPAAPAATATISAIRFRNTASTTSANTPAMSVMYGMVSYRLATGPQPVMRTRQAMPATISAYPAAPPTTPARVSTRPQRDPGASQDSATTRNTITNSHLAQENSDAFRYPRSMAVSP